MQDDFRDMVTGDEEPVRGTPGWLPAVVVLAVVGGFVALSWYAYHAGTQSVKDDELMVVEADKTPMKEKPADPGGMKFPNQDKTIFDTFAGDAQQPKVERVVPAPEEPLPANPDASGTTGWVNDKLLKADPVSGAGKPEQVFGTEEKKAEAAPVAPVAETKIEDNQPVGFVARRVANVPAPVTVPAVAVATEPVKEKAPAKIEKTVPAPPEKTGPAKAQLGAYRSEKEAKAAWAKITQAHRELFSGHGSSVFKADLGPKGIYYRLRATGFTDASDVKAFCSKLNASGQACIVAAEK